MKRLQSAGAFVLGGELITLGILRSLGRHGIPVTVFKEGRDDIAFHSRFARAVSLGPKFDPQHAVDRMIAEARKSGRKPVLFVAGDRNLLTACRHKDQLREHLQMVLPPRQAAETVVCKDLFDGFARAHAVPVPRSWNPSSLDELRSLNGEFRFPLVLKPVRSGDWNQPAMVAAQGYIKMIQVDDFEALITSWSWIAERAGAPLVQEFIRGDDSMHFSCVSYRDRNGRELASFCIQKLRLHPIHGGVASFARVVSEPELESIGRRVLEQLGYRGPASVCFKRDAVTAEARIFEINGRLPLAHGIAQLAGIDLPWLMYRDALGLPCEPAGPLRFGGNWLSLSHDVWAARDYRRAGELSYAAWLRSLLKTRMIVDLDPRDPGPFLFFLGNLLRARYDARFGRRPVVGKVH